MRRPAALAALAALSLAGFLASAGPAAAIQCDGNPLVDEQGIQWHTSDDIGVFAHNADAYSSLMAPSFARRFDTEYYIFDPIDKTCAFEDGGRELRYPPVMVGDLEISGTVFVPVGAPAFQRSMLIMRNPNPEPAALTPFFFQETEFGAADTNLVSTSSGDTTADGADDWLVVKNGADAADPRVAFVWNFGPAADRRRSAVEVFDDESPGTPPPPYTAGDQPMMRFDRIVVPPGQTVTYLIIGLTRAGDAAAVAAARDLQLAPDALLAGLSDDERRGLQNVGLADTDVDGLANGADNCRLAPNPDQADLDGDASGDACDDDGDGDGVADAVEAARGLDPRKADTDGDGRRDDADLCPLRAGLGADGCPRFDQPVLVPDTTKPGATIRGLGGSMKLKAFRRGVSCVVDLTEAARVVCRLLVRATRGARIASAGDLEVASRSLPLGAGRRSARLKPKRGLIRQRRFRATLQVSAIDAAGNRTVKTKRFRVR
jgi:thrombospondin type 3 repeat protein